MTTPARLPSNWAGTMLEADDLAAIERVADRLAGGHSETAAEVLVTMMCEVARHERLSGAGARAAWLRALRALGETCLTLHRLESRR